MWAPVGSGVCQFIMILPVLIKNRYLYIPQSNDVAHTSHRCDSEEEVSIMNHNEIDELKKIQPAVIYAIATESGMSKNELLELNKKMLVWMSETEMSSLTDVIQTCQGRYDQESFMAGVLIASVITHNTISLHFKKVNDQRNTRTLYSNAGMEFL